jgi:fructose-bisphosphate aldolase, class II
MPHAKPSDLMLEARNARRGIGAFNAICLEHAEAIVQAAEEENAPVILQISENTIAYHGGRIGPLAAACRALIDTAAVPMVLHLDHATSFRLCREAADAGFTSVMFDASVADYAENVRSTAQVAEWARSHGIWIEAELGEIGGKDGAHAPGARTNPAEAAAFAAATGVDSLAVAIGSSHGMLDRSADLDLDLLSQLVDAVDLPLVLHGSSGVADELIGQAVDRGMVKVNVATQLNQAFTENARTVLSQHPHLADPRKYLGPGRDAMAATVRRLIRVLGRQPVPA